MKKKKEEEKEWKQKRNAASSFPTFIIGNLYPQIIGRRRYFTPAQYGNEILNICYIETSKTRKFQFCVCVHV